MTSEEKLQHQQKHSDEYIILLRKYLDSNPDALAWICIYGIYAHAIDDIIDNDIPSDKTRQQFILQTFEFAEVIYSSHFYQANLSALRPLIKMASNDYMDSVLLEGDTEEAWKKHTCDALRQTANAVILAVIEIVGGIEKRREASLELRELSYRTHHKEDKPI
jgi:hypothetical protein